ncbi:hypothetical protein ACWCQS_21405 [Streptomyces sp. NPDC002076]
MRPTRSGAAGSWYASIVRQWEAGVRFQFPEAPAARCAASRAWSSSKIVFSYNC